MVYSGWLKWYCNIKKEKVNSTNTTDIANCCARTSQIHYEGGSYYDIWQIQRKILTSFNMPLSFSEPQFFPSTKWGK